MARTDLGRLRKGREFDHVYEKGTVSSGPFFVIRALPNELDGARAGFAVGKKLVPLATRRNLVRRRLRGALRAAGVPGGLDVIVSAKSAAVGAEYGRFEAALARELALALERARSRE